MKTPTTSRIWSAFFPRQSPKEFLELIDLEVSQGLWKSRRDGIRNHLWGLVDADADAGSYEWTILFPTRRLAHLFELYCEDMLEAERQEEAKREDRPA